MADSGKRPRGRAKSTVIDNGKTYQCQSCCKKYLSYSALYTHNKLKHNIIISTKGVEGHSEHPIQTRAYKKQSKPQDLASNSAGSQNHVLQNRSVETVVNQFIRQQCKNKNEEQQKMRLVLRELMNCTNENSEQLEAQYPSNRNYCQNRNAAFIPLIFNFFINDYLPALHDKNPEFPSTEHCIDAIFSFWKFLFSNKITLFEVKPI